MATREQLEKYELTIGIECHVQLATKTKLFSSADNDSRDREPNSNVSPIDYGLPGMLPVLNKTAVDLAIRAGKALNAEIAMISRFDRKHYFYPDLPKGYQTTQMYQPVIGVGIVDVPMLDNSAIKVRIHHAHMEEDAGKLTHFDDYSLVDLNRAGTPLIEIVTEPDMHSPQEARAFASELYLIMKHAGVTYGDLFHGNMRFDVNVSAAPIGSETLGTRAEVKNLNSFRSVEKAAQYEFERQVDRLEKGELIVQETRGWDDDTMKTSSQRSKEDAQDYRYMPDADIPPVVLTPEKIEAVAADMPLLPAAYRQAWESLQLDKTVTVALLDKPQSARLVQRILDVGNRAAARRTAHWLQLEMSGDNAAELHAPDELFIELSNMVEENLLSSTTAKQVCAEMLQSGQMPREIAEQKNLLQNSNEDHVAAIVDQILADPASQQSLDDIKNGKDKAIGYLVGQVMKLSQGKANPAMAQKLIRERIT